MQKRFGIILLGLLMSHSLFAQQPTLKITPLAYAIPVTNTSIRNTKELNSQETIIKKDLLALLKEMNINPDSCQFISPEENDKYVWKLGQWDFDYTYCRVYTLEGSVRKAASIHYNGFAIDLKTPKIYIGYLTSDDGSVQEYYFYYYRGLAPQALPTALQQK